MTKYYSYIVKYNYKTEVIELKNIKSESEALKQTIELSKKIPDCIGYSTMIKNPGKKVRYI